MNDFRTDVLPEKPVPQTEPVENTSKEKPKRPAWLTFLWEVLQTLILAVVLYFLIDSVMGRVRVDNISMQPTLYPGEFLLVNKLALKMDSIHQGDIVVFHFPLDTNVDYIKRVVGMPGDTVRVSQGKVYVNERELVEPYIAADPNYTGVWTVPEGNIFVLGDNRNQSSDSHSWGYVPLDNVVGKALAVYWPFNQMKILTQPSTAAAANE